MKRVCKMYTSDVQDILFQSEKYCLVVLVYIAWWWLVSNFDLDRTELFQTLECFLRCEHRNIFNISFQG